MAYIAVSMITCVAGTICALLRIFSFLEKNANIFGHIFRRVNILLYYLPFIPPSGNSACVWCLVRCCRNSVEMKVQLRRFFWSLVGTVCPHRSPRSDIAQHRFLMWKSPAYLHSLLLCLQDYCERDGTLPLCSHL